VYELAAAGFTFKVLPPAVGMARYKRQAPDKFKYPIWRPYMTRGSLCTHKLPPSSPQYALQALAPPNDPRIAGLVVRPVAAWATANGHFLRFLLLSHSHTHMYMHTLMMLPYVNRSFNTSFPIPPLSTPVDVPRFTFSSTGLAAYTCPSYVPALTIPLAKVQNQGPTSAPCTGHQAVHLRPRERSSVR